MIEASDSSKPDITYVYNFAEPPHNHPVKVTNLNI